MERAGRISFYLVFLIMLIFIASKILNNYVDSKESLPNINDMEIEGVGLLYQDKDVTEPSLEKLLLNILSKTVKDNQEIEEHKIIEVKNIGDLSFATFTYTLYEQLYQGVLIAKNLEDGTFYYLKDIDFEVNKLEPLHYFDSGGSINSKMAQRYNLISGYVNDKRISKIYFTYSNGRTVPFVLSENQNTFTEINLDEGTIESIKAVSEVDDIIYERYFN